jgi:undecaprenyl pyrophosphate phosphatase UppP
MKTFFFYCSLFLIAIAGILAVMLFFYWGLLHPVWGIVDAIASDEKSSETRVLWVIVMFLTWTLGSLIYTFFASHSIRLKKSTIFCAIASGAVIVVLGVGGILAAVTYPEDSTVFPQTTNTSNEETSSLNTIDVNVKK